MSLETRLITLAQAIGDDIQTLNTADAASIHDNVAAEISALTEKVTPVSGDHILIEDSAAGNVKKRVQVGNLPGGTEANDLTAAVTWANIPDANVPSTAVTQHEAALTITESQISDLSHTDSAAIHDDTASEISAVTAKATPVAGDFILIEDSAAANVKKSITIGSLPYLSEAEVDTRVQLIVDSAPAALDTLNELAAALGDDANYSATVATSLGEKINYVSVQSLSAAQQLQACENIGVGDNDRDFTLDYTTARDS